MEGVPPRGETQTREPRTPLKVLQGGGGLLARGVGKTYRRRPVVRMSRWR